MIKVYLTCQMADDIGFGHKQCVGSSKKPEHACCHNRLTMIIKNKKIVVRPWIGDHEGQGLILDQFGRILIK